MDGITVDRRYGVLLDWAGLPFEHGAVIEILEGALLHLLHSRLEIEAITRRVAGEHQRAMASQINVDYFADGFSEQRGMDALNASLAGLGYRLERIAA